MHPESSFSLCMANLLGVAVLLALPSCGADELQFSDGAEVVDTATDTETSTDSETVVDTTIPDTTAEETSTCPSGFGCACTGNRDCVDELCIQGPEGRLCTRTCDANCPDGYDCLFTSVDGADPLSICVPRGVCSGENACVDDGKACTVETCTAGRCATTIAPWQCFLDGRCVADGERRDTSGCMRCDAATNQWVAVQAGTTCDDGAPCTKGDVCSGVTCAGTGSCQCEQECTFGQHCEGGVCVDDRSSCDGGVCYFAFDDAANWERFDLEQKHRTDNKGFGGAIFDGKYVLFAPFASVANYAGMFYRYDPSSPFGSTTAWSWFDPSDLVATYRAFRGSAFDGRYAYFAPYTFVSGLRVLRFDSTSVNFTGASAAWSTHNLPALGSDGFSGLVYANGFVFLASTMNGYVRRYDTSRPFDDAASWADFDMRAQLGNDVHGFDGIGTDGRHVYLAGGWNTQRHGLAVRYDAQSDFQTRSSWEVFDLKAGTCSGCNAESIGYRDAVFDGRFVYYIPGAATSPERTTTWVMRYDTLLAFTSSAAWSGFQTTSLNVKAKAFSDGHFDGRYLYLTPDAQAYNGQLVLAYDTRHAFQRASSWRVFNLATLQGSPSGYQGSAFDGANYYLAPSDTSVALRLRVRSPAALSPWQPGYQP